MATKQELENIIRAEFEAAMEGIFIDDLYARGTDPNEMNFDKVELFKTLAAYRADIKLAYRYYLLHGIYKQDRKAQGVNSLQWRTFVRDVKVGDAARADLIFKAVQKYQGQSIFGTKDAADAGKELMGQSSQKKAPAPATQHVTGQAELNLVQYVTALLRLAKTQYPNKWGVAESLRLFLQANFLPHARKFELDAFRQEVVETEAVQAVLRKHRAAMQRCFLTFAAGEIDFDEDKHAEMTMNVVEFFEFIKGANLLDSYLSVPRTMEIFMLSNFAPEDTYGWEDWSWELEYEEFEETIARMGIIKLQAEDASPEQVPAVLEEFVHDYVMPALEMTARKTQGKGFSAAYGSGYTGRYGPAAEARAAERAAVTAGVRYAPVLRRAPIIFLKK